MKRNLRIASLVFALVSVSAWAFQGANRGWTRTSVPTRTVDEVTGIEGIQYQKRFVPGVDFLGGALMVAGLMACASLFLTHQTKNTSLNE